MVYYFTEFSWRTILKVTILKLFGNLQEIFQELSEQKSEQVRDRPEAGVAGAGGGEEGTSGWKINGAAFMSFVAKRNQEFC